MGDFGITDVALLLGMLATCLGVVSTSLGIAKIFVRLGSEFEHVKGSVANLEVIVTNGLTSKVERIAACVDGLPCRTGDGGSLPCKVPTKYSSRLGNAEEEK